jgi:hypothetical protein
MDFEKQHNVNINLTDKPLAAAGLTSYRYRGRYGWIMIGAKDPDDALREASRSTHDPVTADKLEVWNGLQYVPVNRSGFDEH